MTTTFRRCAPAMLAGAALLAACRDLTAPATDSIVQESELTFVRVDPQSPPLKALEVSFWAVRGEERSVQISYDAGQYGNGKCLLFRVPADAIPVGVAPGDSVQVTIRVLDAAKFRFDFLPHGLQFEPDHPAQVEIRYRWADPDFDGDGDVDPRDLLLSETFGLWRMTGESSWERVAAERQRDILEIHGPVVGFTQYALATD